MRQFLSVFKFEFLGQVKNKISIAITIIVALVIAVVLSYPRIEAVLKENNMDIDLGGEESITKIGVYNASKDTDTDTLLTALKAAFTSDENYEVSLLKDDTDLKGKVKSGKYNSIIEVDSPTSFKYIVDTVGLYDTERQVASSVLLNIYRYDTLAERGLSQEEITGFLTSDIDIETIVTGKDQAESFAYTYSVVMVLYMVLIIYVQFVATSVAGEKSSRAMEVLITSARPKNLIFGKVLGTGCAGLLQLVIILASAVIFYNLNKDYINSDMVKSFFGVPVSVAMYSVLFFILGYFIFAFMSGAAGSLATRTEDLNVLTMPINIIFMISFMVAIYGMNSSAVDDTFFVVCSFLPTFAPIIMLVRVSMGTVATWEIVLSIAIQLATILGLGVLCSKIYRAGVLMYGNTPKLKDIVNILKSHE